VSVKGTVTAQYIQKLDESLGPRPDDGAKSNMDMLNIDYQMLARKPFTILYIEEATIWIKTYCNKHCRQEDNPKNRKCSHRGAVSLRGFCSLKVDAAIFLGHNSVYLPAG
jgi:hypothetical protein